MAAAMSVFQASTSAVAAELASSRQYQGPALKTPTARFVGAKRPLAVRASSTGGQQEQQQQGTDEPSSRRQMLLAASSALSYAVLASSSPAEAVSTSRRANRGSNIPEEEYKTLPSGLKIYDLSVGNGALASLGDRVTVHYDVRWKGITFLTSRVGMGVTGGTPYGFDVGASSRGMVLPALDLGVQGMRVGGTRQMIVPPELAYGSRGVQEIPPNATIQLNVELLAVKPKNAFGTQVKLVEG
eukprot:TRINITY_DN65801_c0_g1_i1.p1 TRINITY_DN65801_c0_g1~~TRINITY_DN65801_c0_g1_i1.p1  ORF type:complete len:242 (+),score=13.84 TRINITY_DN65801_c0_g1_i1:50-775(+)